MIFAVLIVINLFVAIVLTKIKQFVLNLVPETMKKCTVYPWILAFLSVAVCVIVTISTSSMGYLTNDDGGIQALLSGNVTGEPYITHQFINILLGIFISTLYKIFPSVQWWYWYSLGVFLIGMYVIHLCFFKQGKQKGLKIVVPLVFVAVMDLVFLAYAMANIAFTIVPAVLGSGLVAAWMIAKPISGRKRKIAAAAVTTLVYVMVLVHRRDTGIVLLCYILLAILYYMTQIPYAPLKLVGKFAAVSIFFIALSAVFLMGNNFALTQINGKEFVEYNSARADYMDYPKQTYEENPELYHEVGWDEDVAALVERWCFVDENVTTESFKHLAGTGQSVSTNAKQSIADFIKDDKCPPMLLLGAASVVAAGICLVWRFDKRFLFFFLANNGGTLVLLAYQIFVGRILYRSAIVVLLPCFVINALFVLEHFALGGKAKNFFTFAGAMLALVLVVSSQFFVFDPARNVDKENAWAASRQVESYAVDHSDITYICTIGVYNILDPWPVYPEKRPTNLIPWGNSSYGSDSYKKRLQINGLTELSADTFLMDQVCFMFTDDVTVREEIGTSSSFFHLFRYLKNRTNMVGFVLEEQVSNSVYVYRFISSENKEDYDSYYIVTDTGKLQRCM